jgi:hypothetical protein
MSIIPQKSARKELVINGSNFDSDLASCKLDGTGRLCLPAYFAERLGLQGSSENDCWLVVLGPGRYRLVTRAAAEQGHDLARLRDELEALAKAGDLFTNTDSNERAALLTRLVPCRASPPRPCWRITIPKELLDLAPRTDRDPRVFLFTVSGHVEIWFRETLREASSVPIPKILD